MRDPQTPNIQIIKSDEVITSCNVCGQPGYVIVKKGRKEVAERIPEVTIYELRTSSNGYQVNVTTYCADCLEALHGAAAEIVVRHRGKTAWTKEA